MKSLIKIVGLVILCGLLIFFGAQLLFTQETKPIRPTRPARTTDTTVQETYISKVILQAPWGEKNLVNGKEESKPGEFGYHVSKEGELGPNTFTVAPNGDIYIADPLNKRIQKFTSEGTFLAVIRILGEKICIDENHNIYLLPFQKSVPKEKWSEEKWFVNKYDPGGNLLKTYPIEHPISDIYCDKKGRLFASYGEGIFQLGTKDVEFSSALQKSTFKKGGFWGSDGCSLDKDQFFRKDKDKFYLVNFREDTVKVVTLRNPRGFIGFDGNLNAYTHNYDFEKEINLVRKYDPRGVLISTIQYYPKHFVSPGVDCQGNLYIFTWFKDEGVEVTKWYKQP